MGRVYSLIPDPALWAVFEAPAILGSEKLLILLLKIIIF